jgi:hypothetical protein
MHTWGGRGGLCVCVWYISRSGVLNERTNEQVAAENEGEEATYQYQWITLG